MNKSYNNNIYVSLICFSIKNIILTGQQGGSVEIALSYLSPSDSVILIIFLIFRYCLNVIMFYAVKYMIRFDLFKKMLLYSITLIFIVLRQKRI